MKNLFYTDTLSCRKVFSTKITFKNFNFLKIQKVLLRSNCHLKNAAKVPLKNAEGETSKIGK